ncbi:hypothetical protein MMC27_008897, partial [Xylographa pallens]|nr:hypothetical protein [Xylographa pallens]
MMANVKALEVIISYEFQQPLLGCEALQLAGNGVTWIGGRHIPNGNKRLAVLGDQVLDTVLSNKWYESGMIESNWNAIRLQVSSNSNLSSTGLQFNIGSVLQGNPTNPQRVSEKIMATAVEAVLGAVFRDGGLTAVERVLETLGLTNDSAL